MRKERNDDNGSTYAFIDLFAGIGGIRLAMEQNGTKCVWSSEIDKFARETYKANYGDEPYGDITGAKNDDIPQHDILTGGFPCQAFSIAGKKQGFNDDKGRGNLFFEICRILENKRPKAFLLENVKNLVNHDNGKTFHVIMDSVEALDYRMFYRVLDARHWVPQHRERIIIIGFDEHRYGDSTRDPFDDVIIPEHDPSLESILANVVPDKYTLSDNTWNYLRSYKEKQKNKGNGFGYSIADPKGRSRTLSARYGKDGSEILIQQPNDNPRKLTPRECARLQGFPDSFKIPVSDTQAYKQFGNSVPVPMISAVAKSLIRELHYLDSDRYHR